MKYRRLGKSGLQVSEFSFGSWVTFAKQVDIAPAKEIMSAAFDAGINFFDNAEGYEQGRSELVMGQAIAELGWSRDSYIVSSKVFWGGQKPTQRGLSAKHVTDACHAALKRLRVDYLDLYFCHRPDVDTPIDETVRAMHNLVQQGKVLYWGTSEWSAQQITEAHWAAERHGLTPPTMEQPLYNLFERHKVEGDYAPLYETFGLGTTIWSPLASGLLTGKYNDGIPQDARANLPGYEWLRDMFTSDQGRARIAKVKELAALATRLEMPIHHLALAWCLANPRVSTVILGASRLPQLTDNLAARDRVADLTPEVLAEIEQHHGQTAPLPRNGSDPGDPSMTGFGQIGGIDVPLHTIRSSAGLSADVTAYGARLVRLLTPDRNGTMGDIVLGHDRLQDYVDHRTYFGATCGRYANRIAGGRFVLDGAAVTLDRNEGPNHLHGGRDGFDQKVWTVASAAQDHVTFTATSPDGEMGYPGTCQLATTYRFTSDNALQITMTASTDAPTVLNIVNHAYFNLAGSGDVRDHILQLPADFYTPVGEGLLTTGEVRPVAQSGFDFRTARALRAGMAESPISPMAMTTTGACGGLQQGRPFTTAHGGRSASGRALDLFTNQPGVQVYTCGQMKVPVPGRAGASYGRLAG